MATRYNWMADTDEKAFEVLLDLNRKMKAGDKLASALGYTTFIMKLAEHGVRMQYPEASDREIFLRAAARRLGRDLMIRAYGWDPDTGKPYDWSAP
jgi:hypothetical protein